MNTPSKNIYLVAFVFIVAIAIVAWLYVVNKNNPIQTSLLNPSGESATDTVPGQLPSAQPARNQNADTVQELPEPPSIPGQKIDAPEISEKYGQYAFETFEKDSDLVGKIKSVYPAFKTELMYVSFPSQAYKMDDGKEYLALGGCTEHDCGGTGMVALYNLTDDKTYLAKESTSQIGFEKYYGNPSEDEENIMLNYYLSK
ncbi:MAG: Ivy family c-type lysozyme inhibitor [Candidatus Moranbacteria bacterium]|nr:Ivy family c-type lysozyme inhibitor [Candidatus Moranbacteria bacterium]